MSKTAKWGIIASVCLFVVAIIIAIVFIYRAQLDGISNEQGGQVAVPKVSKDKEGRTLKQFTVTAKETSWQLGDGYKVDALTYDGTVPGNTLKVTEGDHVQVQLKDNMKQPVTIHWHGYPVPNAMDGVAGMTQDAVAPGKSFTYDFIATVPGTYYYHSHYDSANQVDHGLYGVLIVQPKKEIVPYDKDYILVLDEWAINNKQKNSMNMDHSNMEMGSSNMNMNNASSMNMDHDQMMKKMYNVYSVNGKTGTSIQPLKVKKGEHVRLRLVNAGFLTHQIHLQNQAFQVITTDGSSITDPPVIKNQLVSIGASERYDISFVAGDKSFAIDLHDGTSAAKSLVLPVQVEGDNTETVKPDQSKLSVFDITQYSKNVSSKLTGFQSTYTFHLNSKMEKGEQVYTINGKTWPNTEEIYVKTGEKVKFTLINEGKSDHPMHLHGHTFQVLSKNGKFISEQLNKDTLVVKPGESYEIGFVANNTGIWMFHCHDLHHAAAGMMTDVKYLDYQGKYQPNRTKAHE